MFELYPKIFKRTMLLIGLYEAAILVLFLMNPAANPMGMLLLAIIGGLVFFYLQAKKIAEGHERTLSRLYNELNAEGFLKDYEENLKLPIKNEMLYLIVRIHISNAYCALGRFEDAIALLEPLLSRPMKVKTEEQKLMNRFSLLSNVNYCAEQMGDIEKAEKYLFEMREVKAKLDKIEAEKPELQRMVFNMELNEQCYKLLKTGKCDAEILRTQVQATNTQRLHQITTALWIARANLAENKRRDAEKTLRRIVELAPQLYPGQEAQRILDSLPGGQE